MFRLAGELLEMTNSRNNRRVLPAFALLLLSAASFAQVTSEANRPVAAGPGASSAEFILELNKLEEAEGACRAYLVFKNKTDASYTTLKLDLVMFGADGVISKRLAVEGAPLPPRKTSVKLFEIRDVTCDSIARILLNDVISCRDDDGEHSNCVQRITTRSLGGIEFFK